VPPVKKRPGSKATPADQRIRKQAEFEVELEDKRRKLLVVLIPTAIVLLWILMVFQLVIEAEISRHPWLAGPLSFFVSEATTFTVVGLFLVIFFDTLFFVIFPGEVYFFLALAAGLPPPLAIAAAAIGGVLGQNCNYWMGRYARRKGKDRPRAQKILKLAEKANGRGGRPFLALAFATPSPEIIGFAYGVGNFPASTFAKYCAVFRPLKWVLLYIVFVSFREYLSIFGV
jgi:membrane protein YqaA with SNARE-associated domain